MCLNPERAGESLLSPFLSLEAISDELLNLLRGGGVLAWLLAWLLLLLVLNVKRSCCLKAFYVGNMFFFFYSALKCGVCAPCNKIVQVKN